MIVTKLEQWKAERINKPKPFGATKKTHIVEIECVHCHRHFFRWSSMASAYGRCEQCSTNH
jgi:DNA-directed RNA polymerase subunit RPC12/RpoP